MRLLFTHSYFLQFDPKQVAHSQPYPPLGTLIAAALMRQNNFDVSLHDTMFCSHAEDVTKPLSLFKPDILVIYDDGFNYLTKMCLSNMREAAFKMQEIARGQGCKIIVASSDAADHYEKYLQHGADFVISGEAEYTLLELVNALKDGTENFDTIKGVSFIRDGKVIKTLPRPVSKQLDDLPLPAWDLVDINPYRKVWQGRHGYFSINVATTRGCPYHCNWCAKPMYGNAYNMRSPSNVLKELLLLKEMFSYDHVWFCDDIFGLKRSWVSEFAELVQKHGVKFRYKIQSRADLLIQERYVADLAESGCSDVWMGAESGSQKILDAMDKEKILDAMDKGTTVEQIIAARHLLKKHGIKASFFLQFGYPGENVDDIKKTIALIEQTMPDDIGVSVSYPLPGTVFYDRVKSDLSGKSNWTDSDEMAMMFKNTYSPQFYKQLHRYIHNHYRLRKLQGSRSRFSASGLKRIVSLAFYTRARKKSFAKLQQTIPDVKISF
jgi:anaerobic magnesium-protoporphyrin IX monomethyl ester cyclase